MATQIKNKWSDVFRIPEHTLVDKVNLNFIHDDLSVDSAKKAKNKNRVSNMVLDEQHIYAENSIHEMLLKFLKRIGEKLNVIRQSTEK